MGPTFGVPAQQPVGSAGWLDSIFQAALPALKGFAGAPFDPNATPQQQALGLGGNLLRSQLGARQQQQQLQDQMSFIQDSAVAQGMMNAGLQGMLTQPADLSGQPLGFAHRAMGMQMTQPGDFMVRPF